MKKGIEGYNTQRDLPDFSNEYLESGVYNMDCKIGMKEYPDNHFDLVVVDPQYGIGGDRSFVRKNPSIDKRNGRIINAKPRRVGNWDNKRPDIEYFRELLRISVNQIIFGGNYFADMLPPSSCWIVWDKVNGNSDQADCELCWTSFKTAVRQLRFMWGGLTQGKGVLNGHIMEGNNKLWESRMHPTQKPVVLYEWIFKNYAEEGQKILDTHLGSGSSRIAAYNYKMDFTGYEIDKDYFEAAEKRFQNHIAQLKIFA